ncbi:MFS transporter [Martelella sp. AD-3]|uniref:MFS transporter n=1 Tax=Martelella sp. AD-3 TaxID=686597 RepID=UPI0004666C00|nr:MFS transporter [Martelella sp. AD-3]
MNEMSTDQGRLDRARSVQFYIDERPYWVDGTEAPPPKMTGTQWRIWWLSVAGKFFEGLVVFMTGVAMPLIASEFGLNATQHGMVGSASLFGILIGASALGGLADRFGRKRVFIMELGLFIAFLTAIIFTQSFAWLIVCLFGMGLALGCDYPTAHLVISESTPSKTRGGLVLSAFGFQAVGAIFGTLLGYVILTLDPSIGAWRWMYGVAIIPALAVFIGRFFIPESPHWLAVHGRGKEAESELQKLLKRVPAYPTKVSVSEPPQLAHKKRTGYRALFQRHNLRPLILSSVPWFLQDLGTYGIGIFTPTILAATVGHKTEHVRNVADLVNNDLIAAKGTALLDVLLLVGIIGAVLLADRLGRIRLQVFGFIGCAVGLFIAAQAGNYSGPTQTALIFTGFMLFNFMTNLGPNAQTYLIAGEVFPTHIRGTGAGFAASFAKIGACMTAFLFPVLLADIGTTALLYGLVVTSLLGAVVTFFFRIETRGISLDGHH